MSGNHEPLTEGEQIGVGHAVPPLHFPDEELVPETKRHLELRTLLYQVLKLAFADRAAIGCDQFVYWDRKDPRACLAPDAFVFFGEADHLFRSWKVWEHGVPQVAIEVISDADERDRDWNAKLEKYRSLGVSELVRFDSDESDRPLRIWDLVDRDLVERELHGLHSKSSCLPGFWVALEQPEAGLTLRLSHDEHGEHLYPTLAERERAARLAERERAARLAERETAARLAEREAAARLAERETAARLAEREAHRAEREARHTEAEARRAAERRILELEEALRRKS